ncbi:MAG: cytochrome P450, partial [Ilumatobacteraceae bacterium]|nr:cytochrome P450 [Ilumatobacteraceae bacterium]
MPDEHTIDLYAPETQENWYPTYQKLRDENPVYQMPGSKIFVISRYQDVLHVLRHQEIFRTGTTAARSSQSAEIYKSTGWERITPLSVNPPEHRQYRDLVDHHFDASGSLRWLSFIESTVHELIDDFAGPGVSARGRTDFVQAFAIPLPVRAITRILGFPASDIPQLKEWSTAWVLPFSGPLTAEQDNWVATKVVEFQHYINHSIEEKRINPGDDVISDLTTAMYNGERLLSNHEIITIVDHLYIGGNETTTFAITSALWILLRQPGLYDTVYNDRSLVEQFLEESMRLESPTQGLYRSVAADTEIAGVRIPAGSTVHIRYA